MSSGATVVLWSCDRVSHNERHFNKVTEQSHNRATIVGRSCDPTPPTVDQYSICGKTSGVSNVFLMYFWLNQWEWGSMKTCGIERHQRGEVNPHRFPDYCWLFLDVWAKILKISKPRKSLNSHTTVNRLFLDVSVKIGIRFLSIQTLYLVSSVCYRLFAVKFSEESRPYQENEIWPSQGKSDRLNRSSTDTDLSFCDCASKQLFRVEIWSGVCTVYKLFCSWMK